MGAGSAGELVLKELRANPDLGLEPVGFVDDDRSKHQYRLGNLPVFGSLADIPEVAERQKVQEIIIAMPQASGSVVRNVLHAAMATKVPTRTVPGYPRSCQDACASQRCAGWRFKTCCVESR